jgi:hypothetical protein
MSNGVVQVLSALRNHVADAALLMIIVWIINFGGWIYIYYLDV